MAVLRAANTLRASAPPQGKRVAELLAGRVADWMQRRAPPSDTLELTQRNVYILPSRGGLFFALTLAVLLVASINYQLNLGHLLTFLLAGSGLVGMHMTHANLRGLSLQLRPTAPTFAGQPAVLEIVMAAAHRTRYGIAVRVAAASPESQGWVDVPAGGQATAHLAFIAVKRGWQPAPPVRLQTRFPLGLFTAWSVWRPATPVLVYPTPEALPPALPAARALSGPPRMGALAQGGESDGVRGYRRGDPLKSVVWKKAAQTAAVGGELVARDSRSPTDRELWLSWDACGAAAPEERLSRLTAWVLAAHGIHARYGLLLPGAQIAADAGEAQRERCLRALALWTR